MSLWAAARTGTLRCCASPPLVVRPWLGADLGSSISRHVVKPLTAPAAPGARCQLPRIPALPRSSLITAHARIQYRSVGSPPVLGPAGGVLRGTRETAGNSGAFLSVSSSRPLYLGLDGNERGSLRVSGSAWEQLKKTPSGGMTGRSCAQPGRRGDRAGARGGCMTEQQVAPVIPAQGRGFRAYTAKHLDRLHRQSPPHRGGPAGRPGGRDGTSVPDKRVRRGASDRLGRRSR